MKKFLYSVLIFLSACSGYDQTEAEEGSKPTVRQQTNAATASSSATAVTPYQAASNSDNAVKMTGTVHFSFEQAEFVTSEKTYFIISGYSLIKNVETKREHSGAYNVTLNDVCINGHILTKAQNNGNGFGPLERYEQAVAVEGLC